MMMISREKEEGETEREKRTILLILMWMLSFVRHLYIERRDSEMHVNPTLSDYLKNLFVEYASYIISLNVFIAL
jgi:hypothetical protein